MKAKFSIIFKNWPLTGKDVSVAKSSTLENAQKAACVWRNQNPGAVIVLKSL